MDTPCNLPRSRLVIYYSQSITITITFENIQSITITFENFKSIAVTITLASITSITFYYILLQFGANLRGNFNTEIKLTGYFIHLIFTPQPLRAVGVLFSPMVSGWAGGRAGGRAAGNSLSGLYLRNREV